MSTENKKIEEMSAESLKDVTGGTTTMGLDNGVLNGETFGDVFGTNEKSDNGNGGTYHPGAINDGTTPGSGMGDHFMPIS